MTLYSSVNIMIYEYIMRIKIVRKQFRELNIVLMQHQKRKKTISKKRKASNPSRRSEYAHYQPNNSLTKYCEKVLGINSKDSAKG